MGADLIAVEQFRLVAALQEQGMEATGEGGLAGPGEAREPEREALVRVLVHRRLLYQFCPQRRDLPARVFGASVGRDDGVGAGKLFREGPLGGDDLAGLGLVPAQAFAQAGNLGVLGAGDDDDVIREVFQTGLEQQGYLGGGESRLPTAGAMPRPALAGRR